MGAVALIAVMAGIVVWCGHTPQNTAMIAVPAGSYTVTLGADDAAQTVELPGFRLDRFEATVADYPSLL